MIERTPPEGGTPNSVTRREMLSSVGRFVALGGMVLGAVYLVGRKAGPTTAGECQREFKCSRCQLAAECSLPAAVALRNGRT